MRSLDAKKLAELAKRKASGSSSEDPSKRARVTPAVPISSRAPSSGSAGSRSARVVTSDPNPEQRPRSGSDTTRGSERRPIVIRGPGASRAEKGKAPAGESSQRAAPPSGPRTLELQPDPRVRRSPNGQGNDAVGSASDDCYQHYGGKMLKSELGLHDPKLALQLIQSICLPQDKGLLAAQTPSQAFDSVFVDLLQMAHRLVKVREEYSNLMKLDELQTETLKLAEADLKTTSKEKKKLEEEIIKLKAEVENLQGREAALKENFVKDKEASAEKMRRLELRVAGLAAGEERAKAALQEALAEREKLISEQEKTVAEARIRAVAEYKDSDEYEADLTESALPAYNFGFDECKKKLGVLMPKLHLDMLRIDVDPTRGGPECCLEDELISSPSSDSPALPSEVVVEAGPVSLSAETPSVEVVAAAELIEVPAVEVAVTVEPLIEPAVNSSDGPAESGSVQVIPVADDPVVVPSSLIETAPAA